MEITLTIKTIHDFNWCTYKKEVFTICMPGLTWSAVCEGPYIGRGYLTKRRTMIVKSVVYDQNMILPYTVIS